MKEYDLDEFRRTVSLALLPLLWCHLPLIGGVAYFSSDDVFYPLVVATIILLMATASWVRAHSDKGTRLTFAVSYVALISLLVGLCEGSRWQPDLHMYYFAALAILTAYCDRDVILAAALATSLHHLGMNYIAPGLLFPGGTQFSRVVLHAIVVALETIALMMICNRIVALLTSGSAHLSAAQTATKAARALEAEAVKFQVEQQHVVETIAIGLNRLSIGDFTSRLDHVFSDEYEGLRADFNFTAENLEVALLQIARSAHLIDTGSDEIAQAANHLAQRTEGHAARLEETAVALNAITGAVSNMAVGALEASRVVAMTRQAAETSGVIVEQAIDAIAKIKEASHQITHIIGLIDDIATQTNLLSLNAEIEAAGAGLAGRGFAVVATEVRNLAKRSAKAATDIRELISASKTQVDSGVRLVGETGTALKEIIERVAAMNILVTAMSTSSRDQASGLAEINVAASDMDQLVQQNAVMAEESLAAVITLQGETKELSALVGRFQIGRKTHYPAKCVAPVSETKHGFVASAVVEAQPYGKTPVNFRPAHAASRNYA